MLDGVNKTIDIRSCRIAVGQPKGQLTPVSKGLLMEKAPMERPEEANTNGGCGLQKKETRSPAGNTQHRRSLLTLCKCFKFGRRNTNTGINQNSINTDWLLMWSS